ncbi:YhcH/YjgK/YiaL family protein [Cetobacterium sp.]|uniref:YhcH/YjgK/YiaL family protein n=1 Tax=Cetobacterium sp. TaxID=2071632 RepID=UPI0025E46C5B|nr:YhcH/YjgK/YiaL family protein [uncultured Cetobacterium sp.]
MIFGQLNELKFYKGISQGLDAAIEAIENGSYKNGVLGKNEIDGDNVFFNLQECKTKILEECFFECHKKYIDIHVVIEGEEGIGYSLKDSLKEKSEFNEESDFGVLEGVEEYRMNMTKDNFLVVFPDEPHMPLIAKNNEPTELKKVVFKIKY